MDAILAIHPTAQAFLLIGAIFMIGCIECFMFRYPKAAYVTWLFSLLCATGVIINPPTIIRIVIGTSVFVSGTILMYLFDRSRRSKDKRDTQ